MTPPPPITFAGQGATKGHTRGLRRKPGPAAPRRVSGPSRGRSNASATRTAPARATAGRTASARSATPERTTTKRAAPKRAARSSERTAQPSQRTTQPPRRVTRPVAPRRVSGPIARRGSSARRRGPLPARAVAYVRALPDHRLITRLIHSRGWIPVLGILLSGIVFMQVEVLKLNATMGRAISSASALQSRNELLRNTVSALSDDQRIESLAARNGMIMPAPDAPSFLSSRTNVRAAVNNIHAPDPTAFAATLPSLTNPVDPTASDSTATPLTTALPGVPGGAAAVGTTTTPSDGTVAPATDSTTSSGG